MGACGVICRVVRARIAGKGMYRCVDGEGGDVNGGEGWGIDALMGDVLGQEWDALG